MATSELGPGAYPKRPYGNFALKVVAPPPAVQGPSFGGANKLITRIPIVFALDVFGVLRKSDDLDF